MRTEPLVRRIMDRRLVAHDDDRHRLGADERDALAAVRYIRAFRRVKPAVLRADVADALAITERLRGEVDAEQAALIDMARGLGLSWQEIAAAMGMTSRQGPIDRLRRIRAARRGQSDVEARADVTTGRRRAEWLAEAGRGQSVRELAARWATAGGQVPPAWADDVADLGEIRSLEALTLAVRALGRELAAVGELPAAVQTLVADTGRLLDGFPTARRSR